MLLKFLLVAYLWYACESAQVPKCTSISYTATFTDCSTKKSLFSTSFNLNIESDSQNPMYPNILTYSNFSSSPYNSTYNISVDDFRIGEWAIGTDFTWYPKQQPNYTINYPNVFSIQILDYFAFDFMSLSGILFYINDGEIISDSGSFLVDKCAEKEDSMWCDNNQYNFMITISICCDKVKKVDIPDSIDDGCEEYKSETTIIEDNNNTTYITADYYISDNEFNISVKNFSSSTYTSYQIIATSLLELQNDQFCRGNISSPAQYCLKYFPNTDFQYNFQFVLNTQEDIYHFNPIIGKIQQRNGLFFKDNYQPFTKDDPCWVENGVAPFVNGITVNKSFCCNKFKNIPITTSASLPPSTTTSNFGKCKKYQSQTEVSDGTIYLEVEYLFNSTGIIADITDYFTTNKATAQLEIYSADTFSEVCRVTPKSPTNTCFFNLSQNHKYELQLRTSKMPEGFNMTTLIEKNGQFVTPLLTSSMPCENETHPYIEILELPSGDETESGIVLTKEEEEKPTTSFVECSFDGLPFLSEAASTEMEKFDLIVLVFASISEANICTTQTSAAELHEEFQLISPYPSSTASEIIHNGYKLAAFVEKEDDASCAAFLAPEEFSPINALPSSSAAVTASPPTSAAEGHEEIAPINAYPSSTTSENIHNGYYLTAFVEKEDDSDARTPYPVTIVTSDLQLMPDVPGLPLEEIPSDEHVVDLFLNLLMKYFEVTLPDQWQNIIFFGAGMKAMSAAKNKTHALLKSKGYGYVA